MDNEMTLTFLAIGENEQLARMAITSFIAPLDPTLDQLSEIKTIVSEAVSNAIIHAYPNGEGQVTVQAMRHGNEISVSIKDYGIGIEHVINAMEPLYTTKPELERSGMGFTIMESFADELLVESIVGKGTIITFSKKIEAIFPAAM
jgi:stage II sporulation protein AB (anti-sigma F factor)